MFLKPKHFIFECRPNFGSFYPLPGLLRAITFSAPKPPLYKFLRTPLLGSIIIRLMLEVPINEIPKQNTGIVRERVLTRVCDARLKKAASDVQLSKRYQPRARTQTTINGLKAKAQTKLLSQSRKKFACGAKFFLCINSIRF